MKTPTHVVIVTWPPRLYEEPQILWCHGLTEATTAYDDAKSRYDADVRLCQVLMESTSVRRRVVESEDQ